MTGTIISIFNLSGVSQESSSAVAGGVIASVVVILLCTGGAVFAIVYIQRRKRKYCWKVSRYLLSVNMSIHYVP